jgi:hypothetical protein
MKRLILSVVVTATSILAGCGKADVAATSASSPCVGPNCQSTSSTKGNYDFVLNTGSGGSESGEAISGDVPAVDLCGLSAVGCNPDDDKSCENATVKPPGTGMGGATAVAIGSGVTGDNTATGGTTGSTALGSGTGISGGNSAKLACRIRRDNAIPLSQCEDSGEGTSGDPCVSSVNCAPGFACAVDNGIGQCRHFCCGGNEVCPTGTYCEERVIKEDVESIGSLVVSVCMPAVACRFDEPYPCPADQTCSCPTGRTCGVVRADGTTACVEPGVGLEGEACPCAAGHVCSEVLGTCVKTCSLSNVSSNAVQCSLGVCQSSTSLPADVGICVNASALN